MRIQTIVDGKNRTEFFTIYDGTKRINYLIFFNLPATRFCFSLNKFVQRKTECSLKKNLKNFLTLKQLLKIRIDAKSSPLPFSMVG